MPAGAPPAGPPPGSPRYPTQRPAVTSQPQVAPAPVYVDPAPAVPTRKPILLLSLLLLLLGGGIAFGVVKIVKPDLLRNPVGAVQPVTVDGPGLEQMVSGQVPAGPSAITSPGGAPLPGRPAVAAKKGDPDVPPSPVMAQGGDAPRGPSVVNTPQVASPAEPPVMYSPAPKTPSAPPATGLVPKGTAPAQPQAPRDNSDFDRYIQWLRYVEQERSALRAQGETESFRVIEGFYQAMLGMADPDFDERQFDRGLQVTLQRTLNAIQLFRQNILRTKPPVPSDCKALDQYYMAAVSQEGLATANLLNAMARKDIGGIKSISRTGVGNIDWNLGQANLQLEQVYRGRGLNQQFRIETGGNSSMLGGLMGLGGFGGVR